MSHMTGARIVLSVPPAGLEELLEGFSAFVMDEGRRRWTWHDSTFGSVSIEVSDSAGSLHTIVIHTDDRSHVARERTNRIALRLMERYAAIGELTWLD